MSKKRNIKKLEEVMELIKSGEIVQDDLSAELTEQLEKVAQNFSTKGVRRKDINPGEWFKNNNLLCIAGTARDADGVFYEVSVDSKGAITETLNYENEFVIPCDPPEWFAKVWERR